MTMDRMCAHLRRVNALVTGWLAASVCWGSVSWGAAPVIPAHTTSSAPGATPGLVVDAMASEAYGGADCAAGVDGAFASCSDCRFTSLWGSVDYLVLWEQGRSNPVLVTTSPSGTARLDAGIQGLDTTQILFGGERIDDTRLGGRITFGMWWDRATQVGIGASYLGMGESTIRFQADSSDFPILARPFSFLDQENAVLYAFPGESTGSVGVTSTSELNAAEVFKRQNCRRGANSRLDVLVGYRYSQLQESLRIDSASAVTATGQSFTVLDQFDVDNTFHAGQLGLWSQARGGNFSLDVIAKVALGQMTFDVDTQGRTVVNTPNQPTENLNGGLLVQTSNRGNFSESVFGVMPEFTANIGYQINPYIDLTLGYTLMYWSRIVHPGDLIDRTVDLTQLTNSPTALNRPEMTIIDSDFWLQGLTVGLNFRY